MPLACCAMDEGHVNAGMSRRGIEFTAGVHRRSSLWDTSSDGLTVRVMVPARGNYQSANVDFISSHSSNSCP
jgi:hypothetical protein